MYLLMRVNGQKVNLDMDRAGQQAVTVGDFSYQPARLAQRVRKQATRMWGENLPPDVLDSRIYFEVADGVYSWGPTGDGANFTPAGGASVILGRWNEEATAAIALHVLAHEVHLRSGAYDMSETVVREALGLLAEREARLVREFDREPYYTASNLVAQLTQLRAFMRQPFKQRWNDMLEIHDSAGLADMVNYYLDRSESLGLARWLQRYSQQPEVRDQLLQSLAYCTLRYSLEYRRIMIRNIVRCSTDIALDRLLHVIDAVVTLDRRYPDDDIGEIINFCFAPLPRLQRKLLASG